MLVKVKYAGNSAVTDPLWPREIDPCAVWNYHVPISPVI